MNIKQRQIEIAIEDEWVMEVAAAAIVEGISAKDVGPFCAGMGMCPKLTDEVYAVMRKYHS